MKILMFGWDFSTRLTSGLGTACYGLSNALTKLGVEINYLFPHPNPTGNELSFVSGIDFDKKNRVNGLVENLNYIQIHGKLFPYSSYGVDIPSVNNNKGAIITNFDQILSSLEYYGQLCKAQIENKDYDLIHVHDWPGFPAAFLAKQQSGKPLIVHVHSTEIDRNGKHHNPHIFNLEKKGFEMATSIIAVSEYTKNILIDNYDIAPAKIVVVHPGTESYLPSANKEKETFIFKEKIISYVGRFARQKNPTTFVNIASKLLTQGHKFRFMMAGDGGSRAEIIELVAKLGISRYFHFPGHLDNHELADFFQLSNLLLIPSWSEPFGLVALEAASANLPIVITEAAGVNEVLPGVFKFNCTETEYIANEIVNLFKTPAKMQEAVATNNKAAKALTWDLSARKVSKVYNNVLNQGI